MLGVTREMSRVQNVGVRWGSWGRVIRQSRFPGKVSEALACVTGKPSWGKQFSFGHFLNEDGGSTLFQSFEEAFFVMGAKLLSCGHFPYIRIIPGQHYLQSPWLRWQVWSRSGRLDKAVVPSPAPPAPPPPPPAPPPATPDRPPASPPSPPPLTPTSGWAGLSPDSCKWLQGEWVSTSPPLFLNPL